MYRLLAALLAGPALVACAAEAGGNVDHPKAAAGITANWPEGSQGLEATPCRLDEVERGYLRLANGDFAYVEPQHFARASDGWVLAGQPAYRVHVDERGRGGIVERAALFGVTFGDDGALPIPMPPIPSGAEVVWVRGVPAMVPGRLGFLYEVQADASDGARRFLLAEFDRAEGTWEELTELPTPPVGRLRGLYGVAGPIDAAEARTRAGRQGAIEPSGEPQRTPLPVLAVPHELPEGGIDVLLVARGGERWESRTVWERWIDEIAIGSIGGSSVVLALAGLDPDFGAQRASIRTMEVGVDGPGPGRPSVRRHQEGAPGERFVSPVLARAGGRLDLGWLRRSPEAATGAWVRAGVARVTGDLSAPDDGSTPGGPGLDGTYLIDSAAEQIVPVDGPDDESLWVTRHMPDAVLGGTPDIVVTRLRPGGPTEVGRIPDPFHGPFTAGRSAPEQLLVVGPEARYDPTSPYVRSLIIRLSIRCNP